MKNPPRPDDETLRLEALRAYGILDTPPEAAYDDLALLLTRLCEAPIAMVSLIDENRQWCKARVGLDWNELPREHSFCAHAIASGDDIFEVGDAREDERFADNPFVTGAPRVRFYAGTLLRDRAGLPLGTLAVIDRVPRRLGPAQREALGILARQVVAQLELRRGARELEEEVAERVRMRARLAEQVGQAAEAARENDRLLAAAERSRRALLSVLEDEKAAGRNLRESEERFREMAESIQEVFRMTDPVTRKVLYMSPVYEQVWGRSRAACYDEPLSWLEAVHPEDRERVFVAARTTRVTEPFREIYRIVRPDGAVRWIRDRAFPVLDEGGAVRRIVGTAEDITEHRNLEDQFIQAQKMEAIGTLAGGIAHDFNNILGAILGYTELLGLQLKDQPQMAGHLGALLKASQRGVGLVRQILTFSRQGERMSKPENLAKLVAEPLTLLRATIPANIDFDVSLAYDLPPVLADATQIHQVVMNLCTNAAHAMKDRVGRLGVRLEACEIRSEVADTIGHLGPGSYARLTVSDTGRGMTSAVRARIFEPFFTTKKPGEGTGLGLAVVHGVMESHAGAMRLRSAPDEGTTFELFFPLHTQPEAEPEVEAQASPVKTRRGNGERILLVDDEPALVLMGRLMLEARGYRVEGVTDVLVALERVRDFPNEFDLVISDVSMPGMTGVQFARLVNAIRPALSIILTTGLNLAPALAGLEKPEVAEVLRKPFSLKDLSDAVHRALARSGAEEP